MGKRNNILNNYAAELANNQSTVNSHITNIRKHSSIKAIGFGLSTPNS